MESPSILQPVSGLPSFPRSLWQAFCGGIGSTGNLIRRQGFLVLALTAAVVFSCVLRVLWISDIAFTGSDPDLMLAAFHYNQLGKWADPSLTGGNVSDGLFATWLYQFGIRIFESPADMALVKAILISLVTLLCLAVWSKHLTKNGSRLVFLSLLSPILWLSARDLGAQSWAVPLAILFWTQYLLFDQKPSLRRLCVVTLSGVGLFLAYFAAIPLIAAVVMHLAVKHRVWIVRRWAGVLVFLLGAIAIGVSYVNELRAMAQITAPHFTSVKSFFFIFRAPEYFSAEPLNYFLGKSWASLPLYSAGMQAGIQVAYWVSMLSFIFFGLGVALAFQRPKRFLKGGRPGEYPLQLHEWCRESDSLAMLTLVFFLSLSVYEGWADRPSYFNGIWPAVFFLVWRGMAFVWRLKAGKAVVGAWAFCTLAILFAASLRLHVGQGTRSVRYGPTLGNLMELTELAEGAGEVIPVAPSVRFFPHAMESLKRWKEGSKAPVSLSPRAGVWLVNYRYPKQFWSGALELQLVNGRK